MSVGLLFAYKQEGAWFQLNLPEAWIIPLLFHQIILPVLENAGEQTAILESIQSTHRPTRSCASRMSLSSEATLHMLQPLPCHLLNMDEELSPTIGLL